MKPLDPKLLKYVKSAQRYVFAVAILGILAAGLVFIQTITLSGIISPVINGKKTWADIISHPLPLIILTSVLIIRILVIYIRESLGHTAANQIITDLRSQVISAASRLGPRWLAENATDTATLSTRGLDALVPYCVRYLPQLLLTMTVTPMALIVMLWFDFWSALIAVGSIPLIPIFMILVGKLTQQFSDQKIAVMEKLGSQVLDLLSGLVTMKALGREKGPEKTIRDIGTKYTESTMATLRLAFLSGAILEFISTLAVALVAVEVGLRLVYGSIDLYAGLIVIMLAPEVYNPLRQVGVQFHASADGVAAINQALRIIETKSPQDAKTKVSSLDKTNLIIEDVSIKARGTFSPYQVNATISANSITALVGPSGVGKTTLAMAIMGFQKVNRGKIYLQSNQTQINLAEIDIDSLHKQIMWVPQSPVILPGSALNSVLPDATIPTDELLQAAHDTGFDQVIESLPQGWNTELGHGGVGLSVGQRQRLALTRALVEVRPIVVLDEPTAHLDALSEKQIINVISKLKSQGSTVIVIAHRDAVIEIAEQKIYLRSQALDTSELADTYSQESSANASNRTEIDTFFSAGGDA